VHRRAHLIDQSSATIVKHKKHTTTQHTHNDKQAQLCNFKPFNCAIMHAHCHAYAYMKYTMRAFLLMFAIAKFSNALLPLMPTSTLSSRFAAYMTLMRSSAMRAAASPALMVSDTQVSITLDRPMRQGRKSAKDYYIRCQDTACTGVCASYGYEADGRKIRCAKHKEDDMVDLINRKCNEPKCNVTASFGYEADKKKLRCFAHKDDDMVSLTSRFCKHPGCKTQPSFGLAADKVSYVHLSLNLSLSHEN
jgi:EsV-1-7 cysteine-rich motif